MAIALASNEITMTKPRMYYAENLNKTSLALTVTSDFFLYILFIYYQVV
jgi:hypothetical protein